MFVVCNSITNTVFNLNEFAGIFEWFQRYYEYSVTRWLLDFKTMTKISKDVDLKLINNLSQLINNLSFSLGVSHAFF